MKNIDAMVTLLKQYMGGDITPSSSPELQRLIEQYPVIVDIMEEVKDEEALRKSLSDYILYTEKELLHIEDRIITQIHAQNTAKISSIPTPSSRKNQWKPLLTAAASVIFIVFAGYGLWTNTFSSDDSDTAEMQVITPGSNRATLTFSDGKTITLQGDKSGIKINDDITYQDGSMVFSEHHDKITDRNMLLSTPRGGQYFIELSDGSKVWLNAQSSLQYPTQFSGNTREVKLIGEAYFEVKSNTKKPFIVTTNTERVEVLGTHFNINSYPDAHLSHVTLSEGKVRVAPIGELANTHILLPNSQAIIKGATIKKTAVNAEEYTAWKDGEFMFNNEPLSSVLQKLSRWYDFDYSITPALRNLKIWGSISKYENFDKVLRIIKITDRKIKLNIQGKKVIIMEDK